MAAVEAEVEKGGAVLGARPCAKLLPIPGKHGHELGRREGESPADPAPESVTFVGHATALLSVDGIRVLTDPVFRDRIVHLRRRTPLPRIPLLHQPDAVLISHAHLDHLDLPSLRTLPPQAPVFAPSGSRRLLGRAGLARVTELAPGERTAVGEVEIMATPADHAAPRYPLGRTLPAIGFVVSGRSRIYFAGDTDLFEGMHELAGGLDIALVPIAGWGPRVGAGHLDPGRAAEAVRRLMPRYAVPIHWGTFSAPALRSRDPQQPAREFERLAARVVPDVAVRTLLPGETLAIAAAP